MNRLRTLELIRFGQMLAAGEVDAEVFESPDLSQLCRSMAGKEASDVWRAARDLAGGVRQDQERIGEFMTRRLAEDVHHVRKAKRLQKEWFSHQLHVDN